MLIPQKEQISCLDFKKCMDYVSNRIGRDLRDYDNAFEERKKPPENRRNVRLRDFWEVFMKRYDIKRNGEVIDVNTGEWLNDIRASTWEKEIVLQINDRFQNYKDENGNIKFIVRW